MLQNLVVALAVIAAALYTAWSLTPSRARLAALTRLDAALGPGWLRGHVVAPLLKRALPAGGCAGCGSSTPPVPPAPAARRSSGRR